MWNPDSESAKPAAFSFVAPAEASHELGTVSSAGTQTRSTMPPCP